jgi:hypothetical protein
MQNNSGIANVNRHSSHQLYEINFPDFFTVDFDGVLVGNLARFSNVS